MRHIDVRAYTFYPRMVAHSGSLFYSDWHRLAMVNVCVQVTARPHLSRRIFALYVHINVKECGMFSESIVTRSLASRNQWFRFICFTSVCLAHLHWCIENWVFLHCRCRRRRCCLLLFHCNWHLVHFCRGCHFDAQMSLIINIKREWETFARFSLLSLFNVCFVYIDSQQRDRVLSANEIGCCLFLRFNKKLKFDFLWVIIALKLIIEFECVIYCYHCAFLSCTTHTQPQIHSRRIFG